MTSFKGRSLDRAKKVDVYRNLNDSTGNKRYSIRQNGLVIGHSNLINLKDVRFIVNQKGRERVLRERRKNVHAFIRGFITENNLSVFSEGITYNPYKCDKFTTLRGYPVNGAFRVHLNKDGVWADMFWSV